MPKEQLNIVDSDHYFGLKTWTSAPICSVCYNIRQPGRVPIRMNGAPLQRCCVCTYPTPSGIFERLYCEVVLGRLAGYEDHLMYICIPEKAPMDRILD